MRPSGIFAVLAAVFWIALGRTAIGFYEIGGFPMALPFGIMTIVALLALRREAGTRVNPPRGQLWMGWLLVLTWLLVIAWAQFIAPRSATGVLGLVVLFVGGAPEAPALLQAARAVHIGVGAALLGWSFVELVAESRMTSDRGEGEEGPL